MATIVAVGRSMLCDPPGIMHPAQRRGDCAASSCNNFGVALRDPDQVPGGATRVMLAVYDEPPEDSTDQALHSHNRSAKA